VCAASLREGSRTGGLGAVFAARAAAGWPRINAIHSRKRAVHVFLCANGVYGRTPALRVVLAVPPFRLA
jgi:hypothetical protein